MTFGQNCLHPLRSSPKNGVALFVDLGPSNFPRRFNYLDSLFGQPSGIEIAIFFPQMLVKSLKFCLFGLPLFIQSALAEPTELEQLSRCYADLTGTAISPQSSLVDDVLSGSKGGIEACLEVLDWASLDSSSGLTEAEASSLSADQIKTARASLRNFMQIHRSWFPATNFRLALNLFRNMGHEDLYSHYQAAKQITYLLFANQSYDQLLQGTELIEAIREVEPEEGLVTGWPRQNFRHNEANFILATNDNPASLDDLPTWNPPLLQQGDLRGLAPYSQAVKELRIFIPNSLGNNPPNVQEIAPFQGLGGGAMGAPSYLLLNMGLGPSDRGVWIRQNGVSRLARRWSEAVYRDFLCRDLPVIGSIFQIPEHLRADSEIPYRANPSCASCHVSMDGMAGVIRNLSPKQSVQQFVGTSANDLSLYAKSVHIEKQPVSAIPGFPTKPNGDSLFVRHDPNAFLPAENFLGSDGGYFSLTGDNNWHRREPKGLFAFETFDGQTLYNQEVTGLDALGQLLTQTPDFYVCAAERYFEHFTQDRRVDFIRPSQDQELADIRSQIIQWGQSFQSHKQLRLLIEDILTSDLYQKQIRTGGL